MSDIDGLIERLRREGDGAMRKHLSLGMHTLCAEAADAIDTLRKEATANEREIADLHFEISKIKHGDGWKAYEDARRRLGEIIGDNYADRSMWPRLTRTAQWYEHMKVAREAAESRLSSLRHEVIELVAALRPFVDEDVEEHSQAHADALSNAMDAIEKAERSLSNAQPREIVK